MQADFYSQINSNKWKTFLLFFLFSLLIIGIAYVVSLVFMPGYALAFIIIAFIFSIIYILIMYYMGDSVILSATKAKPITQKQDLFYYNTVEGLAIAAGVPMPKIYMIQEDSINAFASGRDPKHASITVTSGCRTKLKRDEFEGVVAHEMSHIRNFDIRTMMLAAVLVGVIALLSDFMLRGFLFGGARDDRETPWPLILVAILLAILAPLIAELIKLAISRKREYLADASGAKLTRCPQGLANALKKISNDTDKVVDTANKGMAHLFIENPLRNQKGFLNSMFSTHPPIQDRIKRLEAM